MLKVAILADFPIHLIPGIEPALPVPGYFATWFPQQAEAFAEMEGVEIHWITLSRAVQHDQEIRWLGQSFHLLPAGGKGSRATSFYRKDRARIKECLDRVDPDLVHGWGSEDVYGFAAVLSGRKNLVSMQGLLSHLALKSKMHPRVYFQALLEIFIIYKANCVTIESEWGRNVLARINPWARYELIEYGVSPLFLKCEWRPEIERPVALFAGTLCAGKGIQDLVAAFADPALARAELWVAGKGESKWVDALKSKATPNVHWLGALSREDLVERMSRSWLLALPSRAETSPNVVKEARVIGLPVVTSPNGGQVRYVIEGETGFLVKPGDIPALTGALTTLLGDIEQCRRMGANRQIEQRELLHPRHTVESFVALYRAMLANDPS